MNGYECGKSCVCVERKKGRKEGYRYVCILFKREKKKEMENGEMSCSTYVRGYEFMKSIMRRDT
jgi:hypothetical protein